MPCLQIIFLSGKSNKYLIILDFLWKEIKILKVGFSNVYSISWSYEIIHCFVFTSLKNKSGKFCTKHAWVTKWMNRGSFGFHSGQFWEHWFWELKFNQRVFEINNKNVTYLILKLWGAVLIGWRIKKRVPYFKVTEIINFLFPSYSK